MTAPKRPAWLTDDQVDALRAKADALGRHIGRQIVAEVLGVGRRRASAVAAWLRAVAPEPTPADDTLPPPAARWEHQVGSERQAIHSVSATIRTLDDALEAARVDLVVWQVERYVVNKWDQGSKTRAGVVQVVELWQVKVWLRRRVPAVLEDATAELVKRLEPLPAPRRNSPRKPAEDPHLLELALVDHHFGKLAWRGETGNDYDLDIAERLYLEAVEDILAKTAGYQVARILFPVGHDLFNYDNPRGETAGGTPQDNDSRPAKVYATALRAVAAAVELAAEVAPVEVRWVRGNHDPTVSFWLALALEQRFRLDHHVEVVTDPRARQYVRYGVNLLGLTHGDLTQDGLKSLPTIMAAEVPDLWAATQFREWHVGHLHKRKELRVLPLDTYNGVAVRVLPSLCGTDAWHYDKGYVGNAKATDAYLWSRDRGFTGHFVSYAIQEAPDASSTV